MNAILPRSDAAAPAPLIYVVEDDAAIAKLVVAALHEFGFATEAFGNGATLLRRLQTKRPDLCIVDLGLPDIDGIELVRQITTVSSCGVLILTGRGHTVDRVMGLELGADDYVVKPFSPRELAVRARNVMKRSGAAPARDERLVFDRLAIDAGSREVTKDGQPLRLTAREFDLLWFLASNPRRVFSRDHLMARVWGYEAAMDTGTVTVHMRRLREKVEDDPSQPAHLETVWGVGYRFAP